MRQQLLEVRRWWRAAAALIAVVAGGAFWAQGHLAASPALDGAVLTPPIDAYNFRLPDPDGRMVSLAGLRGKVVALTFLYAHCPDYCPLIAEQLAAAHAQLIGLGNRVAFVAVSVDPSGDTPDVIREFLAAHHVAGVLTYVRGTAAQLRPVWARYFIGNAAGGASARSGAPAAPPAGGVNHTATVYVIDPRGRIRVILPADFSPKDLVTDVRVLARTPQ
jgi:protein SCO1/2